MADDGEDYDFEGNASMIDLIARMGDIDKAIEDINDLEKAAVKKSENAHINGSLTEEVANEVEDVVVDGAEDDDDDDDDDVDAGLADLQKEIKMVEELQEQSFVEEIFTVSCVKPTPESAIGVSMKSSKGVTRIVSVNPLGLLANSELRPNMRLASVNGIEVKNAMHAKHLINIHPTVVVLVVKTLPPLPLP
jgi:hypothetical protein